MADATASQPLLQKTPARSYRNGSSLERAVGFLAASVFSVAYVAAPLFMIGTLALLVSCPRHSAGWWGLAFIILAALVPCEWSARLGPHLLGSWPFQQIPKFFEFEEFMETTDLDIAEAHKAGKRFIFAIHPHGIFSFVGVCSAISAAGAIDGLRVLGVTDIPTAAASVIRMIPILKNVLGVFGVIDAGRSSMAKRLKKRDGSAVIYVGGMAELFRSSAKKEVCFLNNRKGFIKLAMSTGADVIPVYMFGNTTVLQALTVGPLAKLSRTIGVSVTFFWGRWGLPVPKAVKLTYARGLPLGLPHIPEPTAEDVDYWHKEYCKKIVELFDNYKGSNPDYKNKTLVIE